MKRSCLASIFALIVAQPLVGAIGIDTTISKDQGTASTTVSTPAFSTTSGNELLLAFISADGVSSPNTTVTQVAGGGLTWVLVERTNVQKGTAEIWRAFAPSALSGVTVTATLSQRVASSITVMSFSGVNTSGTNGSGAIGAVGSGNNNPGAPTATLVTKGNGSLVLGVGNDWDNAITRTPGTGQTVVHQYLAPVGDTYWVQMQSSPTLLSGTSVTVNDTAPTGDRYNLSIVEVLAAAGGGTTGSISGAISPAMSANGALVTLSQNGTTVATLTMGTSGSYLFNGVANGTYTVTPSEAGFTFTPPSQSVMVNGNTATVPVFNMVASSGSISGTISPATSANGALVTLSQNGTTVATLTMGTSGSYLFNCVANGTYTVTPSEAGFTFSPPSQSVMVNGNAATVPVFTATALGGSISGTINPPASGNGATVTLSQNGTTVATLTMGASGSYTFSNVANGTYTVTPSETGFTFSPTSRSVMVNGNAATVPVFTATQVTWTISGTLTSAASGAIVTLTQGAMTIGTAAVGGSGAYSFSNVPNGTYTVTPSETGFTFSPPNRTVPVNGGNVTGVDFTEQGAPPSMLFPDLKDIIPPGKMSVVQTSNGRQFQYTHDTFNAGPGPLVIQPVFNSASGSYQGNQYIYSLNSSGVWTLSQTIPIAGAFIFDSDHAHFHFPLVSYGLYTVAANGGPGTPVVVSNKVSFCINDSFIYDPTLPHAGALGNLGSCTDPTSLRGLNIGAVDEYDQTDAGQSILINSLPDGTYWLRALDDPDNFLAEADKTNNETDVELTITANTIQVLKTVIPVLNAPPSITLTSPSNGTTISGTVQLTANTAMTSGVQYLIDGQVFGGVVSTSPYSASWDTTTVPNGTHWLAAQTKDPTGIIGTSTVALVTVSNTTSTGPVVQLTSPVTGSVLSATVTLYATVGSSQPISNVVFYVDFVQVGLPVTAPPFMISWDATKVADGQHVVTVSASDTIGNVGKSAPVTVTVNNSHPANLIGTEVSLSVDGAGALITPQFSTTTVGDLLVAFVSYDGPSGSAQTATVSGAGLTWTLLERSNTQPGTAEIWSARADRTLSAVTVSSQPGAGSGYHGSLTVIAFTNAAGTSVVGRTGASSGAPDIPLPGVIAGDWVFAVGNDWDKSIARTPVSGQVLVHQRLDTTVGDTYWVQSTAAPSTANTLVDIHDSSPTTDQWNYAAVEIVATHQ
jgi:hypothetical protein